MARTIGIFAFILFAIWTLLSLGAWTFFSLGGDLVHAQLDSIFLGDPNVVPTAAAIFRFFQNLGLGLVVVVWTVGSLLIWLAATVMRRLVRSLDAVYVREPGWTDFDFRERPMKDVTPPRDVRALPRG